MDKYFESLKSLGFDKNTSLSNIKKSYLELVQIMHPDRFYKENLKKRANKELQKINDAYNYVIKNYDSYKNIDKSENNQNDIYDDFDYDFENTEDIPDYFSKYNTCNNEYHTFTYKNHYSYKKREINTKIKILIYISIFILFNIGIFVLITNTNVIAIKNLSHNIKTINSCKILK